MQQWIRSYQDHHHRKMLFPTSPTGAGRTFLSFLGEKHIPVTGNVLDIGCGNGRNSIALAKQGFTVCGIDGIPEAISDAKQSALKERVRNNTTFQVVNLADEWPFDNNVFQHAIDINTFSSLDEKISTIYPRNLHRVLQPGGYFFLYSYTIQDEYYAQFLNVPANNAQPVGYKILCTDDMIERVLYTQDELLTLFTRYFEPVFQKEIIRYSKMFDTYYKRHFVVFIFAKK